MDHFVVANLERELCCLDGSLLDVAPRKDHGPLKPFYEPPPHTMSRLDPPSKTKSVYPFGDNGTLAWATPAGELLQVASCIDDRLIGVECKKITEKGDDYNKRGKMLEGFAKLPQGSGCGIGLSLATESYPEDVSWVHNRWPRFTYRYNSLDIALQYHVEPKSQLIVQQYQIRNTSSVGVSLPYIVSSDASFREHTDTEEASHPISSGKSPERLLLFNNSEVTLGYAAGRADLRMSIFLNAQRLSLWTNNSPRKMDEEATGGSTSEDSDTWSDGEQSEDTETRLREIILSGEFDGAIDEFYRKWLFDEIYGGGATQSQRSTCEERDFATHRNSLTVPGKSTQELSAVIQISNTVQPNIHSQKASPKADDTDTSDGSKPLSGDQTDMVKARVRREQHEIADKLKSYTMESSDTRREHRASELAGKSIDLGRACAKLKLIGQARYHFYVACVVVEIVYSKGSFIYNNTYFHYAKFLDDNGWHAEALKTMEKLFDLLTLEKVKDKDINQLYTQIRVRIASAYLKYGDYEKAVAMYETALSQLPVDEGNLGPIAAQYVERVAWAQVHQAKNEEAFLSYKLLLDKQPSEHRIVVSNLGFIKKRLGYFLDAKNYYEEVIQTSGNDDTAGIVCVYAQSGLFSCLNTLGAEIEIMSQTSRSLIPYVDINLVLSSSSHLGSPFKGNSFDFALSRQLESLLSVCRIPISGHKGISGIAFVNADPLHNIYVGRVAYFQFRALVQCQKRIDAIHNGEIYLNDLAERIKTTCKLHLVWVFSIAELSDGTWRPRYSAGGKSKASEVDKYTDIRPSYSVEGAFQFLKVCLYFETWREDWKFVLQLLRDHLDQWLMYLVATQHMSNLWVESIDFESLTLYHDNISIGDGDVSKAFPRYHLSDAALLWLALLQLEQLVKSIEEIIFTRTESFDDNVTSMILEVRTVVNFIPNQINRQNLQSNILRTFKVSKRDLSSRFTGAEKKMAGSGTVNLYKSSDEVEEASPIDRLDSEKRTGHLGVASHQDSSTIVYRRTFHSYTLEIQASDMAVIEASTHGLFQRSDNIIEPSWQESLEVQENTNIQVFNVPRHLALVLWTSKLNVSKARSNGDNVQVVLHHRRSATLDQKLSATLYDSGVFADSFIEDGPGHMKSWSALTYEALSLCLGSQYEECMMVFSRKKSLYGTQIPPDWRPQTSLQSNGPIPPTQIRIMMPETVDASSKGKEKYVIDAAFLPDWMYFYPDFIHEKALDITAHVEVDTLNRIKSLGVSTERLTGLKGNLSISGRFLPFRPAIVDSGVKRPPGSRQQYTHEGFLGRFRLAEKFLSYLRKPRSARLAKKRLIEISSQDITSALICLLTSPENEKSRFQQSLRRHLSSENFFGECVDWKMNIWETELHLAFYRLMDNESEDRTSKSSNFHGGLPVRNMPSLLGTSHARKITPIVMSFRFVGDLRDRFWTCTFISSATPSAGSVGFVEGDRTPDREKLYAERLAQRRLLELSYVERFLVEMSTSTDSVFAAFQKELDVPESRDPPSESFEFIFSYSSLYMRSGEILRDIWRRLDSSIQTVEEWERREETRHLRSRWSAKDEDRYGKRLKDLTQKCKSKLQVLRTQHKRLEEQKTFAEQRHSNLVSYMQLREARTSTRSAEDVRLFTYVTIIFLPLSFSSSLFSMQGSPQANTVSIMVQTTAVALAITILFLSNLKTLDRNWSFYLNKANTVARSRMKASEHPWALDWHKKQMELEEVARRRISKMDYAKPLPAESKWWYFLWWLTYGLRIPRSYVIAGFVPWQNRQGWSLHLVGQMLLALLFAPACFLIFIIQLSLITITDFIDVLWVLVRSSCMSLWGSQQEEQGRLKRKKGKENADTLFGWLRSPPRPIYAQTQKFTGKKSKAASAQTANDLNKESPELNNKTQSDSDKVWAHAINDNDTNENEIGTSEPKTSKKSPQSPKASSSRTEVPRNWRRLFDRSRIIESEV